MTANNTHNVIEQKNNININNNNNNNIFIRT